MKEVVGISFEGSKKVYYFDPSGLDLKCGMNVIVETERGLQFGYVETSIFSKKEESLNLPLKKVLRVASSADLKKHKSNLKAQESAMIECQKLIDKYDLKMKLVDANYTFDREQLMYHFLSDNRIDFRNLAKDLAALFKTRIELRQIGVRDKAKEIGGIGPCGRILCCTTFLSDFDTVSINMAKNQNISLNPNKINGSCGRLLCCLNYENDVYEEYRKGMPNIGEKVKYKGKTGKVIELDILKRTYIMLTDEEEYITVCIDDKN